MKQSTENQNALQCLQRTATDSTRATLKIWATQFVFQAQANQQSQLQTNKAITLNDAETVEDTSVSLAIKQISYFNYKVDDIDKRQAVGGVLEALNKEATQGLANEMDKYIAALAGSTDAVKYAAASVKMETATILAEIDKALQKLYENDVYLS